VDVELEAPHLVGPQICNFQKNFVSGPNFEKFEFGRSQDVVYMSMGDFRRVDWYSKFGILAQKW
jgi:hypothetical protein